MSGNNKFERLMQEVKEAIIEQLNIPQNELKEESHFAEDLGADSLDLTELIMAIEDLTGVEVNEEKAQEITTLKKLRLFLEEKFQKGELQLS